MRSEDTHANLLKIKVFCEILKNDTDLYVVRIYTCLLSENKVFCETLSMAPISVRLEFQALRI